jgi:uncharacterized membrane protein YkvI
MKDFKVSFPLACVWFGSTIGPAIAAGTYSTQYYIKYGAWGMVTPIVTAIIIGVFMYIGMDLIRSFEVKDYDQYATALYGKHKKIFMPFFELRTLLGMFIGNTVLLSMGGSMLNGMFSLPYAAGVIITIVCIILLSIFGAKVVRNASTIMSTALIIAMLILAVIAIPKGTNSITESLAQWTVPESGLGLTAVWTAAVWGFQNAAGHISCCAAMDTMKTRRQALLTTVISVVMFAAFMIIASAIVFAFYPECNAQSTPNLWIVNTFFPNARWLFYFYNILVFLGLFTTGPSLCFGANVRFGKLLPQTGIFKDQRVRFVTIAIVFNAVCLCISFLGLQVLVGKVIKILGYLAFPFILLPLAVLAPKRIRENDLAKEEK